MKNYLTFFLFGFLLLMGLPQIALSGNITMPITKDEVGTTFKVKPVNSNQNSLGRAMMDVLDEDGAWCWFGDPKLVHHKGEKDQTYFGWISSKGEIVIAAYNHETGELIKHVVKSNFEIDDHNNPSIFVRKDGRIIVFYASHMLSSPMYRIISDNPEDITSWGSEYSWGKWVSYPNPYQVGDEIHVLYRGVNRHPTLAVSTDNGETFTENQLVVGGDERPYARYCQGSDGSIHIAVTTGHPRDVSKNRVFYCKLKDGKFYKADGTYIKDFAINGPISVGSKETAAGCEMDEVYNGQDSGKGWIWDIALEPETENPVLVYASFPTNTDHRYHYAYWDEDKWLKTEITNAGGWFPQTVEGTTEKEPNYSGGISLDPADPSIVYLSKEVEGGTFEIFRYTTLDKGLTWDSEALTENTPSDIVNVRPFVPRNRKEGTFDVLWMRGKYTYFLNGFKTSIMYKMSGERPALSEIRLPEENVTMMKGGPAKQIIPTFVPFIANKEITWSSSDETVVAIEDNLIKAVNKGTATITAKTSSGISATCNVVVLNPDNQGDIFFNFGTPEGGSQPLTPEIAGAIKVTEKDLFSSEKWYGWEDNRGLASRYRSKPADDTEKRSFIMGFYDTTPTATFCVILDDGDYTVTVLQGESDYPHSDMDTKVDGEKKISVTSTKNDFFTNSFKTSVTDNLLKIEFSTSTSKDVNGSRNTWIVNSVKIEPSTNSLSEIVDVDFEDPDTIIRIFSLQGIKLYEGKKGEQSISDLLKNKIINKGAYIMHLKLNDKEIVKKMI